MTPARWVRAGVAACLVAGCGGGDDPPPSQPAARFDAHVRWTTYGVPHVRASDHGGLGYGYGYAVARDQLCALADRIITLRGERSAHFGPDGKALVGFLPLPNLDSDLFYRMQLSADDVDAAWKALSPQARALAEGYAAGFNRYVRDHAAPAACGGLRPPTMAATDVLRAVMQIGTLNRTFLAAPFASASLWDDLDQPERAAAAPAPPRLGMASNTWAYGADATGTGAAIVVANPHTYWQDHWLLMHQMHLTIPGELDVMGADFLGVPLPLSGFNDSVAWSIEAPSTVTYGLPLRLDLRAGATPAYVVDGVSRAIERRVVEIGVRQADGSTRTQAYAVPYTALGPLYRLPAAPGRPAGWYAVTDAAAGDARGLDQMLDAAKARDVADFQRAVAGQRGIAAHLVAGDSAGNALFIEAGPILDIDDAGLAACAVEATPSGRVPAALDGSRGACLLRDEQGRPRLAPADRIPALSTRGVAYNANDSYSLSIHGERHDRYSILFGSPDAEPNARTRMSHRLVAEMLAAGKVTVDKAVDVVFGNRNYAAETLMDGIQDACASATGGAATACGVLSRWDRRNNADSRGALLFGELWPRLAAVENLYAQPYDPAHPLRVRMLSGSAPVQAAVRAALAATIADLGTHGLKGDEAWGRMLARPTAAGRVPLHGGSGDQGILNALEGAPLGAEGYGDIVAGTAYMHAVTWTSGKLVAKVMAANGQSADAASPHHDDQVGLFSRKQLVDAPFTDQQIAAATVESLRLAE
ncbi:penicillin acylase family protein [Pigmentiphaga sp. GD03639]|uniref:N-acyl homoserine lactone acylase QqaR n=1 Tax=Pigmentiphaga daeguensis TaxID=414049 RepID=A0ABN1CGC8_9BURK|nr:penicillin acylase family protein [Pigmentiphaga sp. GD03639]MDH2237213.1 penicillin acylase family protein [Pigmentiphaga sp. GD03639]